MEQHNGERPVGDIVKDATQQAQTLIRQEIELAKVELSEKGKKAGIGAGMFGGAGLFGLFAFGALTAAFEPRMHRDQLVGLEDVQLIGQTVHFHAAPAHGIRHAVLVARH